MIFSVGLWFITGSKKNGYSTLANQRLAEMLTW